jgi:hypothetical protein
VSYLQGMHRGMPSQFKNPFQKIMLTLSLICHVFSVGMYLMSDFRLVFIRPMSGFLRRNLSYCVEVVSINIY